MLGVCVEKSSDHALVLRVVFLGLGFEKCDATPAQGDRDLDPVFTKYQVFGSGKKVRYDLKVSEGFVRVLDFRFHRFVCPFASTLRPGYG
jgi:hypothetical protein